MRRECRRFLAFRAQPKTKPSRCALPRPSDSMSRHLKRGWCRIEHFRSFNAMTVRMVKTALFVAFIRRIFAKLSVCRRKPNTPAKAAPPSRIASSFSAALLRVPRSMY